MLGALPFLLVVFGTPVAVLALVPANLAWQRFMRGRDAPLSRLYLKQGDAEALAPRLRSAWIGSTVAIAVGTVAALAALAAGFLGVDGRLVAVAGPAGATLGLLVLLVQPARGRPDAPAVSATRTERRLGASVWGVAASLLFVVIAAGVVSVPDPPTSHLRAFPRASLIDWSYSFDGIPKDFEYTPNGVTVPWPGWYYGLPILAAATVLVGAYALIRLAVSRRYADAEGEDAVGVSRLLVTTVATCLAASGLTAALGFLLTMAGDVLVSVSAFAKPQLPNAGMLKPMGHTQPEYGLGLVGLYSWVALVPAALILFWIAVFAARDLRSGSDAARHVLRAAAPGPGAGPTLGSEPWRTRATNRRRAPHRGCPRRVAGLRRVGAAEPPRC